MDTYAGDVKKINLKIRRQGTLGDNWDINLEEVLETKELYYDDTSPMYQDVVGDFLDQAHVNHWWNNNNGSWPWYIYNLFPS